MKLTKRLIPAFAMLLVSAVLMSTASFAWFSMNDKVEVTGMTITATQTDIFLEISADDGATYSMSASKPFNEAAVRPVNHKTFSSVADITKTENWYFKVGTDPTNSQTGVGAENPISSFAGYVAQATYQVRANPNTAAKIYDLYVESVSITDAQGGTTVIIAGPDGYQEFTVAENGEQTFNVDNVILGELDSTPKNITVYVFINGEHEKVFTNNSGNLGGEIAFSMKAFPRSQD